MTSHEDIRVKPDDSKREFEYKGLPVVEFYLKDGDGHKLVWVWKSIFDTVIDGVANPCFIHSVPIGQDDNEARAIVQREFTAYWFTKDGIRTCRTVEEYKAYKANLKRDTYVPTDNG